MASIRNSTGIKTVHKALTASADVLSPRPLCIYVNASGTATLTDEEGVSVEYNAVAGSIWPFSPIKFTAGTAELIGWYD